MNTLNIPSLDNFVTMKDQILPALLLVFVIGLSSVFPISAESETTINLSNTGPLSHRAQLSVHEDVIFVVWQDESAGEGDIFFSKGSAQSLNFEDPINLSDNIGKSAFPRFAVVDDKVFTTWYDYSPGRSDIYFSRSIDDGISFETFNISENDGVSFNPWIGASGNNVYVVWNDDTRPDVNLERESKNQTLHFDVSVNNFEILLATSHDDGSTFEITTLSDTLGDSINPRIAVSENNVYVIWSETKSTRNISLSASTDGGITFNEPVNVSDSQNLSDFAAIQADDKNVHILWRETNSETVDIFYARSDNNGLEFSTPIKLSQGAIDPWLTRDTNMVVSDDEIYVVWYEKPPNNSGVYFVKSIDGGKTFTQPINLSGPVDKDSYPQIANHDKTIYVIWNDDLIGDSEVFLRKSTDGGETFSSIENLSNEFLDSNIFILGPQIALTEEDVVTIFERKDVKRSNLFLNVFNQSQLQESGTLFLETMTGTVNIQVDMDKDSPNLETPSTFTLRFYDSETGEPLENVNYSFIIRDFEGNEIVNNQNQLAEAGMDNQKVQFSARGPINVIIEVIGLGNDPPYDTKYSGTTSAIITVVPEFPIGVLAIMIPVLSAVIILSKMMGFQSRPKNLIQKT